MDITLSANDKNELTNWSDKFRKARAVDLEKHTNSLLEDTYHIDSEIFNSIFYWPSGHSGPVEELPYLKNLFSN